MENTQQTKVNFDFFVRLAIVLFILTVVSLFFKIIFNFHVNLALMGVIASFTFLSPSKEKYLSIREIIGTVVGFSASIIAENLWVSYWS